MKSTIIEKSSELVPVARALLSAPRALLPIGALTASLIGSSGCVSRLSYEEAASAAEVEREGHRRADLELAASRTRVAELEAQLKSRSEGIEVRDQRLAEEKYQTNVATKERDETASLLTQLRGELARANEHLETYSRNNARLERELGLSRQAAGQPSPLMNEVRALLESVHLTDSVRLSEGPSGVVLSVPSELIFKKGDAELSASLGALSGALGRFVEAHPELALSVREGAADPTLPESIGRQRRESLQALMSHPKLNQRVKYALAQSPGAQSYEITLGFADPSAARP
ncbi:MAG: hypothetical protein QM756_17830 [Polyangiaceae bacterium]